MVVQTNLFIEIIKQLLLTYLDTFFEKINVKYAQQ